MHRDETRRPNAGPALGLGNPEQRSRITRPLDLDDLVPAPPTPALGREVRNDGGPAAHATQQLAPGDLVGEPVGSPYTTQPFRTEDRVAGPDGPHILRPVQIILEPSYVPMAPSRPAAVEALMPAGVIYLRPWRGEQRQIRISEANAVWLHSLALHAMSVPISNLPTAKMGVVPMTLIMRYEGFARRWTVDGPGQPLLNALIKALLELAGHDLSYSELE